MKAAAALKRLVLGRPMSSGELEHTLLPKVIALPVFASDPLSSNAYATQEILIVLGTAGTLALSKVLPISLAVAALLIIVVTSYRQTVRAYPSGGGAYRVARENLGLPAGLLAAAALLIDYVMTVAVSITAGVDAMVSAAPSLDDIKVPLVLGFISLVTMINLRGVKESGTLFAVPTYGFVLSIFILLGTGFVRCLSECPKAESFGHELEAESALTFILLLRAFSAGTTALTGVEAIADGVQAFRYPQSKNAASTLAIMGALAVTMFLGISWLADNTGVVFEEHAARTVVAQIAHAVFGGGPLFYLLQVMTAAILVLAANTAYQDFPRLSSILAQDKVMPRQFMNRGDRLVFSNGVLILAGLAAIIVIRFDAELTQLIQLYLVGVFISFTLSQTGMVLRWRKLREPGWRRKAAVNGFGALVTGVVLCVTIYSKFNKGAYYIIIAVPIVMFVMRSVYVHYKEVESQLEHPERRPIDRRPGHQHIVIFVRGTDAATARAIGYARSIRASSVRAVTPDPSNCAAWNRLAPDIPIETLPEGRGTTTRLKAYLRTRRTELSKHDFLTAVVPELLASRSFFEVIKNPSMARLKAALVAEKDVQVLNIPVTKDEIEPGVDQAHEPGRNYVLVLVSGLHNGTLEAIEYAETLRPTDIRALSFGLDPQQTVKLGDEWMASGIPHPLELEHAPFRDITTALVRYVRSFEADGLERVVTIVLPEFLVHKKRHALLHNQTALLVKRRMLFEQGVVLVSVPYHL